MHLWKSLLQSNKDIRILWGSVFLRMANYGLTNQVLTLYLKSLNINEIKIGLFMTLTLIGDIIISYYLTWNADEKIGRRNVMIMGTIMMFFLGVIFGINIEINNETIHFYILLIAAIFGVISPSGDETGPFKSVEEASIAHLTPHNHRPEIFAFYGLFATAGAAIGSLLCGILIDYWNLSLGLDIVQCYRYVFFVYSGIALIKFSLMMGLSEKCEINNKYHSPTTTTTSSSSNNEDSPLLTEGNESSDDLDNTSILSTGTKISKLSNISKYYLPRLLCIFMLDSLGYGFMPNAWIVYYLKITFKLTASSLGLLFFITNSMDSISSLPSAYLSKLIGPVKAILFTQIPSAIFFGLTIIPKDYYFMVAILLILYFTTSSMDVVPRQVLLTSIMPKQDITKVMGIVNIGKTLARCIGPIITGELANINRLYWGFIINSCCVLLADMILAINFLHLDQEILLKQSIIQEIE